jgi:FKBP-type peptidyl-prolyl cis-trans isomerase
MKKSIIFLMAVGILFASISCSQNGTKKVKLETNIDSVSYAIGVIFGTQNLEQIKSAPSGDEINTSVMASAFTTVISEGDVLISDDDAKTLINNFFQNASTKLAQKNLEEGNAFLEKNKAREGVVTTASGLQYEIITEGKGPKPTADDQVKVDYTGTLIDGTVFDSSVERGQPATFGVGQVIPGWTEALELMPVGSKWKIYIPADLAYGERGAGNDIGPNATLIFEVELLEIVK